MIGPPGPPHVQLVGRILQTRTTTNWNAPRVRLSVTHRSVRAALQRPERAPGWRSTSRSRRRRPPSAPAPPSGPPCAGAGRRPPPRWRPCPRTCLGVGRRCLLPVERARGGGAVGCSVCAHDAHRTCTRALTTPTRCHLRRATGTAPKEHRSSFRRTDVVVLEAGLGPQLRRRRRAPFETHGSQTPVTGHRCGARTQGGRWRVPESRLQGWFTRVRSHSTAGQKLCEVCVQTCSPTHVQFTGSACLYGHTDRLRSVIPFPLDDRVVLVG